MSGWARLWASPFLVRRAFLGGVCHGRNAPAADGAGAVALNYSLPIAAAIIGLIVLVAFSYMQTIRATPPAAARTSCRKKISGTNVALVAAAALLIDYVLTVIVSILGGRGGHHLGVSRVAQPYGRFMFAVVVAHRHRQPARHPRIGRHLLGPTYVFIISLAVVVSWAFGSTTPAK